MVVFGHTFNIRVLHGVLELVGSKCRTFGWDSVNLI